jgi:hypothetical protein
MPYVRSLTLLGLLAFTTSAAAQIPQPTAVPPPPGPELLSRYDFHMSIYQLYGEEDPDQRYSWDSHFGGSFDLVDYVYGRVSVLVDYEAVMGHEYRPFDLNQGNYTLEASLSGRVRTIELAGFFHHTSRHLSDRPKPNAVAWNVPGGQLMTRIQSGDVTVDVVAELGRVIQHSFVDYTWIGGGEVKVQRPVNAHLGIFVHGSGHFFGVDGTIPNRGTQFGMLAEGGVRVASHAGALEAFAGFERRVDAYPLERVPKNWVLAGFRLLSR